MRVFNWIKTHKLLVILALLIAYLLQNSAPPIGLRSVSNLELPTTSRNNYSDSNPNMGLAAPADNSTFSKTGITSQNYQQVSDSSNRVVIQESNLSLLVKDVKETGNRIIGFAKSTGGYMVSASYNSPSESAFATVSVRVPTDRLDEALNQFRELSIKVTNENLVGTDVTQEYQDLDQRLATLNATKTKFDEILKKATTVQEILEVNREIINLEQQIDYATGQKMALADNARLTKITLFLSTDELALPYTPDKAFRPGVVFKLAVRSLLSTVQDFAEFLIWAGVFSLIWIPLILIVIIVKKHFNKSRPRSNTPPSTQSKLN